MPNNNLILIVDDNPYNLQILGKILKENSYQIALANNGFKALGFAKDKSPDLILLDIMLPNIDGFEVCRLLKNNNSTKDIPIIFVSAITDTEKKLKAFEIGGVDYINKPFHKQEVLVRVKTQLELSQTQKRLEKETKDQAKIIKKLKESEDKLNDYYHKLEIKNLELERLYNELEAELDKGSKLQQQFLPKTLADVEGISYQAFFQPSSKLGGDFYDVIRLGDQLLFYLADVSGHGLDGAMLNIFLRETINNYLLHNNNDGQNLELKEIINHINDRYFKEDFPADYFICLLMGVLDSKKMEFRFINAGFQFPPYYINRQGEFSVVEVKGLPISAAIREHLAREISFLDYKVAKLYFKPGDTLFLSTDGLLEELVGVENYGEERLEKVLKDNYQLPNPLMIAKLKDDFKQFAGALRGSDDITFLSFKRDLNLIEKADFTINSSMEEIYKVEEKLGEIIAEYSSDNFELMIGFQEIAINAVEHGNNLEFEKEVLISVKVTTNYLEITVKDQGSGFDWQEKKKEDTKLEDIFVATERGRGIILAQKAYDEICYNESGNQVYLFKELERRGEADAKY